MDALKSSVRGAAYIFSQQLVIRIVSFVGNIYINRRSPFGLLGTLNDMELFHSTLLFFARETIRMALLRNPLAGSKQDIQILVNMAFLPIFGLLALCPVFAFIFYNFGYYFSDTNLQYRMIYLMYFVASALELAAEPWYIYFQFQLLYRIRVNIEGFAFSIQSGFTLASFLLFNNQSIYRGLIIYGIAHILYSSVLLICYVRKASVHKMIEGSENVLFFPTAVLLKDKNVFFDPYLLSIAYTFVFQTVVKHLLTVGDKIALLAFSVPVEQKGAYRLVNDLGSLVARILFLPVEETSRAFYSKTLTNVEVSKEKGKQIYDILSVLVKSHLLLGGCFMFLASNYTRLLLDILYPAKSANAAHLLSMFCCYVPFLGLNGITEAFLQAVGDSTILKKQALFMVLFWCMFSSSCFLFMVYYDYGSYGLILSNMVNMLCRIIFSSKFIYSYFAKLEETQIFKSTDFVPGSLIFWLTFIASWFSTSYSKYLNPVLHLSNGLCCFSVLAILFYISEKNWMLLVISRLRNSL